MSEYAGEDIPDTVGEDDFDGTDPTEEDTPPRTDPEPEPEPQPESDNHVGGSRMARHMAVGETFVWGRSPAEARRLLAAARDIGMRPEVVKFAGNGFIVPDPVYDQAYSDSAHGVGSGGEF